MEDIHKRNLRIFKKRAHGGGQEMNLYKFLSFAYQLQNIRVQIKTGLIYEGTVQNGRLNSYALWEHLMDKVTEYYDECGTIVILINNEKGDK